MTAEFDAEIMLLSGDDDARRQHVGSLRTFGNASGPRSLGTILDYPNRIHLEFGLVNVIGL